MPEANKIDLLGSSMPLANRLPDLTTFRERLFRSFRNRMFQEFRRNVAVEDMPQRTISHDDYFSTMEGLALYAIVEIEPIRGLALMSLSGALLTALVDDFFGAGGLPSAVDSARGELTGMERRIGKRVAEILVTAVQDTLVPHVPVTARIMRLEAYAALASVADADEPFVVLASTIQVPTGGGLVTVALPYRGLEAHRDALSGPRTIVGRKTEDPNWQSDLETAVDEAAVTLRAEIGVIELIVQQLERLAPGDILPVRVWGHAILRSLDGVALGAGIYGRRDDDVVVRCLASGDRSVTGESWRDEED